MEQALYLKTGKINERGPIYLKGKRGATYLQNNMIEI